LERPGLTRLRMIANYRVIDLMSDKMELQWNPSRAAQC
jgi:hypothetical protein